MAKPNTILIRLVSSAGTGFYYVTKKIRVLRLKSWNFVSTILSFASMSYSRKRRSSSFRAACSFAPRRFLTAYLLDHHMQ